MLTITDAALHHLHGVLSNVEHLNLACFRFRRKGDESLGLVVEEPEPGDQTFECDGDTVLAAPEPLTELLSQRVLDLDDNGDLVLLPRAA